MYLLKSHVTRAKQSNLDSVGVTHFGAVEVMCDSFLRRVG